jgi:histidinol dehydrogenase
VRVSTVQRMTSGGLRRLASTVITLARQEGLEGHARSIEVRER